MNNYITYIGGPIFDGEKILDGYAAQFAGGFLASIFPASDVPIDSKTIDLRGDILSPGYVDLQVNGGGGVMFNDDPSVETLKLISSAHRNLGTVRVLPTLITDTPEKTRAAIQSVISAVQTGVPGIAGLHLEGPHLSVARKGAHDASLIRPMTEADLTTLVEAAQNLHVLMVTVAPESVTKRQVSRMAEAGIVVALGHSDANYATCMAYADAGARCVTHLFNAMSQLGSREPGLVGAALTHGGLAAGLIADGIHVHPSSMRAAWSAKVGPGELFLVTDAMAVAGTEDTEFFLEGRCIRRENGRLTLKDGTLAGADLDMTSAIRTSEEHSGIDLARALRAATIGPARLIGAAFDSPSLLKTPQSDFIRIRSDISGVAPFLCY